MNPQIPDNPIQKEEGIVVVDFILRTTGVQGVTIVLAARTGG